MTYEEFINNIIESRGRFNILNGVYFENHHIIPKSCGGLDDASNRIWLYPSEHLIWCYVTEKKNNSCDLDEDMGAIAC